MTELTEELVYKALKLAKANQDKIIEKQRRNMIPEPIVIGEIRELLAKSETLPEGVDARSWSIVKTKLEEALLWGQRAMEKGN